MGGRRGTGLAWYGRALRRKSSHCAINRSEVALQWVLGRRRGSGQSDICKWLCVAFRLKSSYEHSGLWHGSEPEC